MTIEQEMHNWHNYEYNDTPLKVLSANHPVYTLKMRVFMMPNVSSLVLP